MVRCDICATSRGSSREWGRRGMGERRREKQRLDYGESRESGWTVSLARWHTAAARSLPLAPLAISFLLRWYQRADRAVRCVRAASAACTNRRTWKRCAESRESRESRLHLARLPHRTARHDDALCAIYVNCWTRALVTPARFTSLRARGIDYIGYKTYWDRWNERVTRYRYPRFAAAAATNARLVLFCPDVFLYLFDICCTVITGTRVENN